MKGTHRLANHLNPKWGEFKSCSLEKQPPAPPNMAPLRGQFLTYMDAINMLSWWIVTHGGFFSVAHQDSAGTCTYSTVVDGSKVWSYSRADVSTRGDAKDAIKFCCENQTTADMPLTYVVLLQAGDTMYVISRSCEGC